MKFVILVVNSSKEEWASASTELYLDKIKHFVPIEHISVASPKMDRAEASAKIEKEGLLIEKHLKADDYVVLLDERGKVLNSEQWSKKTNAILNRGKKRCCFVIGGAFGISDTIRKRADETWSLSPLVFNHFVAQTV